MRVAMIHWGYPPVIGGVETHLSQLCPFLAKIGHSVFVLTGSHPDSPDTLSDKGVSVTRLPIMDLNALHKRGLEGVEEEVHRSFRSFLDQSRPDVIHVHNFHYFSEVHAKAIEAEARERGIPLILTAHNTWAHSLCLRLSRGIAWDHIIAVSDYTKRSLKGFGLNARKITVIHHGIEGEAFLTTRPEEAYKEYPQLRGRRVIFHPARMCFAKGSDVVVEAFRLVKRKFPDAFLVLAGTKNSIDWGENKENDIAYVLELLGVFDLRDDVLIDQYPVDAMPMMYAASEIIVYPSAFQEPFGLVMLEAFASAKPIIVTRAGGMPEVVQNGISGVIIPQSDHQTLARAILRLLKNPDLARKMGKSAFEEFKRDYTLERMADDILGVYQRSIKNRRRKKR